MTEPTTTQTANSVANQEINGLPLLGHFALLRDVEVEITLEIGRRKMRIADVLSLSQGQVLELTKAVGEPLDIYVNGQLLGRGEAVVVGERYGVRITELVGQPGGAR
jgi:flagellar motor switch protein FliN/FliY